MSTSSGCPSAPHSSLTRLEQQFLRPRSRARFDDALRTWQKLDPALAEISDFETLTEVLASRDYARHDAVLFSLLRRAATLGADGLVASELVVCAMLPAVPGVVRRVVRACRAAVPGYGARRGVRGGGVSGAESAADVQAMVLGHLWEQARCYPLRRRHHVAANLVRDTERLTRRSLGIDLDQTAADVISIDDTACGEPATQMAEPAASEELLGLLAWAVEQEWLDERAAAILTARYFGDQIGRDGVATDRQIGAQLGVSQPTVTRHRHRACEQLAAAAEEYPGLGRAG